MITPALQLMVVLLFIHPAPLTISAEHQQESVGSLLMFSIKVEVQIFFLAHKIALLGLREMQQLEFVKHVQKDIILQRLMLLTAQSVHLELLILPQGQVSV